MLSLVHHHAGMLIWVVVALALLGAPIFACMAAIAAIGASTISGHPVKELVDKFGEFHVNFGNLLVNVEALATGQGAVTLSTIPLFTFAGYVMAESKTAVRLVRFAQAAFGWIPGGLAIVTIMTCAIFTTFTGASGVTIVAVGGLLMPALIKEGYKEKFALGLVTSTGSIGLLFPPALPIIVYGIVYGLFAQAGAGDSGTGAIKLSQFSLQKFLFAGIVPGMVLVGIMSLFAVYVAIRDRVPRTKFDGAAAARAFVAALPELIIPLAIIVLLATGWLQIPEAAAVTAVYVLFIEAFYYRDVRMRDLPRIARESLGLVGAIFAIIVAATALTEFLVNAQVPEWLFTKMEAHIHSKYTFLLALNVLLLVVGCLMDIFSAILIVVPLIAPAAARYGIDPYHLGVIFLLNLEVGYIHPPVGLNLLIASFRFEKDTWTMVVATLPFLGLMLVSLAIITYVPSLTPVHATVDKKTAGAAQQEETAPQDGGVAAAKEIKFQDGGVWTPAHCDTLDDDVDKLNCKSMFTLWPKCEAMTDTMDRVECEQAVLDGEDPFTADAGVDDGDGGAEAGDGGAAAPQDAGP